MAKHGQAIGPCMAMRSPSRCGNASGNAWGRKRRMRRARENGRRGEGRGGGGGGGGDFLGVSWVTLVCVSSCEFRRCVVCCGVLCYVMLCSAVLYSGMFCHVLLCYVMFCHVVFCYVLCCYVLFCHVRGRREVGHSGDPWGSRWSWMSWGSGGRYAGWAGREVCFIKSYKI